MDASEESRRSESRTAARARELLVLATMLAVVLWTIFIVDVSSETTRGRLSGLYIGTDFVNFYTLAHVGHSGNYAALASQEAFHAEQVRVLPDSVDTHYPPVYPPQVMLMLTPMARLSYWHAYLTLLGISLGIYGLVVWGWARRCAALRRWPWQVTAAAIASPALWLLVLHGQISAWALLVLFLTWRALDADWYWVAGLALGLLAYKPPLLVPAVALCILAREWRVAAGACVGAAAFAAAAVPWVGVPVMQMYGSYLLELARAPDQVASNPLLMHSLRTLWARLLPPLPATVAYALSAGAVLLVAASAWRRASTRVDQIAIMGAVIVLVSPHLFVYDLLLLTPLVLASADRALRRPAFRVRGLTYAGYFSPLWGVPLAAAGFQASTIALGAWFVAFTRLGSKDDANEPD